MQTYANCHHPLPNAPRARRSAFTLIEVMVTIVILSVLVGMVAVRSRSDIRQRRDVFVVKLNAMLETIAFRTSMSQDRIALTWDGSRNAIGVERLFRETEDLDAQWQPDLLIQDIVFDDPEIFITDIRFNGQGIDLSDVVRTEFSPFEMRPMIELELQWGNDYDLIQLLSHASMPVRFGLGAPSNPDGELRSVDLDDEGLTEEEW